MSLSIYMLLFVLNTIKPISKNFISHILIKKKTCEVFRFDQSQNISWHKVRCKRFSIDVPINRVYFWTRWHFTPTKKLKAEGECSRLYFLLPIGKLAPKGILLWKGNFNFPQPDQSITMHYVCVGKKNYEWIIYSTRN